MKKQSANTHEVLSALGLSSSAVISTAEKRGTIPDFGSRRKGRGVLGEYDQEQCLWIISWRAGAPFWSIYGSARILTQKIKEFWDKTPRYDAVFVFQKDKSQVHIPIGEYVHDFWEKVGFSA